MSKISMYDVLKVGIQDIVASDYTLKIPNEDEYKYYIRQQDTPLFRQLSLIRGYDTGKITELIFVEARHNKKKQEELKTLLRNGFMYKGKRYLRFGKSSSQAKDGITVFIQKDFYKEMMERSQLDVSIDRCTISKYESYRCLIFSSCQFYKGDLPNIVLVDEYKTTLPNQYVRYAIERDVEYIDKESGETKTYKNQKVIKEGYQDIDQSPFDGFGVHTEEMSKLFGECITDKYNPILYQIRLPFLKGVSVQAPIKEFYRDRGIHKIQDIFGKWHKVDDIDCIWNTSMFKAFGIFKKKFGNNAWYEYINRVNKYQYKLGISKYSHHTDYVTKKARMNFQYLQCLDLMNPKYVQHFKDRDYDYNILDENNWGKMIQVAKYSTDLIEKIIKGDLLYTLKFLGINESSSENDVQSKYIESILINPAMLKDPTIRNMLRRKLSKTITQMKYGKVYVDGFYHTVVGDIVGYLEYCAGKDVVGCLNKNEFYADTIPFGQCLSLRSPLVDPSEVNKINIVKNNVTDKYFSYFKDQDVCMVNMYDLTMQQQGGMDMDGDSVMLCYDKVLIDSKINSPIVVDVEDKKSSGEADYNIDGVINYECNSRDNRIGEITNIATSILNQYTEDPKWKKINADNVSLLKLYQGKEIDYVKTGFRWVISKNLRKYLKRLPYFILYNYPKKLNAYNRVRKINKNLDYGDKISYNSYHSPSHMNELCDYITQWEKQSIIWDKSCINNRSLLVDSKYDYSNKHINRKIKQIMDDFKISFLEFMDSEKDNGEFEILCEQYKKRLSEINIEDIHLANYCINIAYKTVSEDKLLCWILYSDTLLENLKRNTPNKSMFRMVETGSNDVEGKEFLGRFYKLETINEEA